MKKTLYILTFLLFVTTTYSQKEYHNWVFGHGSYITFNTPSGDPEFVERLNVSAFENTSVISNSEGDLQFYSFDKYLYNSNEELISDEVDGNTSSTQGGSFFKISDSSFVRVGSNYSMDLNNQSILSYIYINKTVNSSTISDKIILDSTHKTEALQLFKSSLNDNIYLITMDIQDNRENILVLYKFSNNTFNLIQEFRLNHELNISQSFIKYSKFNDLIAITFPQENSIQFFKFDSKEEIIQKVNSNLNLDSQIHIWSVEFSPNGNFLYCNTGLNKNISFIRIEGLNTIQNKDLKVNYLNDFNNKIKSDRSYGVLLGPNRKIYASIAGSNFLFCIENPDNQDNLRIIRESVDLKNTEASLGLPNIPTSFYDFYDFSDSITVCLGEDLLLESKMNFEYDDTTYVWSGPNGFTSDLPNPIIEDAKVNDEGTYSVIVHNSDSSISYERQVVVTIETDIIDPEIIVVPDSIVCNTDEVKIVVVNTYENFVWSTGETTREIKVTESGKYSLEYTNDNGCVGYTEVNISFGEDISTDIIGPTEICEDSEETYSADRDYETYLWSNGDDTKTTQINEAGKYWLEVTTAEGCTISDTIDITYHPNVIAELKPVPTTICEGDSVLLESVNDFPYYSYEWNTGATTRGIYVKETNTYKLKIIDTRTGCMDSTEIAISVEDNLQPTIDGMNICDSNPVTLEALPNDPSYSYEWSNGETTQTIEVSQPASYTVTVSIDGCSGTAEFTVNESPNPEFEILGEDLACEKPIRLTSNKEFEGYLWSTNETTKEIEVTEPGIYTLTVTDTNGCQATEELTVNLVPLSFEILGEDIVCGNTAMLSPDKDFAEYLWSTDEVTKEIEVTEAGTYLLTVTDENGCQATEEFTVIEQLLSFDISKDRIDFGKIYISETRIDSAEIINTSGFDITIQSGDEQYRILDGQTVQYNKTLDPTELGPYTDSFEYRVIEPCDTVITIPVTAEVYASVTISSDNIETEIGKEESISVYLEAKADLGEQTYTITTGLDKSVLYTEDEFTFSNTTPINEAKTKVHEINGTIMLANELEYDITFPSYEFNNPYIEVATVQGKIVIDSVCAFPLRAVTFIEPTEMRVSPNPAKDKLVVDIVSETNNNMTLELISSEGRVAYTENWTQTASEKQFIINTDKIPSGLYQVRLQTPSGVLTENVIVVR